MRAVSKREKLSPGAAGRVVAAAGRSHQLHQKYASDLHECLPTECRTTAHRGKIFRPADSLKVNEIRATVGNVFISNVDSGLERLLRARLPLPEEVGDVAFDTPSSGWSAQLSRITVNFFLYDVQRSTLPSRSATLRPEENGGSQLRRRPQPMVQLAYLVSAWAGNPRDEHQLLGRVVSLLAGTEVLPDEHLVGERVLHGSTRAG